MDTHLKVYVLELTGGRHIHTSHLPKRCLYTSPYTAATEDIRTNSCMQRMRYLEIAHMLQEREPAPFHYSTNECTVLDYSKLCVLCVRASPGAVWVS